ncbi:hypothetical protein K402DRAFT_355898 [Aulographum hederae CBS 113979]|uniref:Homeobox domain-containing protein n=1 Tax=Aulographum hederae CBS 113979 TaxID=1176131 RepID=A0A6G1H0C2_9PEZI|nr:hypothetical protein K402DRAFT_355898 [Aulographum hederae CBS 113979]
MSEPTSPPNDLEAEAASGSSPSSIGSHAFVVHSQDTLQQNLPPDVDNKPLVRQKRKRTSAEDQAILETEFLRNPRPDRASRISIVKRVALGEKEVQIWFQNRRQKACRQSRPLLPEEVEQMRARANSDLTVPAIELSEVADATTATDQLEPEVTHTEKGTTMAIVKTDDGTARVCVVERSAGDSQDSNLTSADSSAEKSSFNTLPTDLTSSQPVFSSQGSDSQPTGPKGYLANRRSASFIHVEEDVPVLPPPAQQPPRTLKRGTSSVLRLSMTSDGKAKLINPNSPSPSPPRSQPLPTSSFDSAAPVPTPPSLRRTYSASGLGDNLRQSEQDLAHKFQRTSSGRSRDSRAWEFWCDSDARNSLVEKAEQEQSGSAADAIGAIRQNRALRSMPNRRNVQSGLSRTSSSKGLSESGKGGKQKSKMSRTTSSFGRLQSKPNASAKNDAKKSKEKGGKGDEFEKPNTDSDKENWEPEDGQENRPRRTDGTRDALSRKVLGENTKVQSQSSSLGSLMAKEKAGKSAGAGGVDEEVAAFMAGGRTGENGEDMDCIQGLLKLSQGNWK